MPYIHSDGYAYAFDVSEEYGVIVYRFLHYIRITIFHGTAHIQDLHYTVSLPMIRTALMFVSHAHPELTEFCFQDETYIDIPDHHDKPLVTSRRLIQGKKGWYEEHLRAEPTGHTVTLLDFLRDPVRRLLYASLIPEKEIPWWTRTHLKTIAAAIRCPVTIFATTWKVTRETALNYNVSYTVSGSSRKKLALLFCGKL